MPQFAAAAIADYFAISETAALLIVDTALVVGTMAYSYEQQRAAAKKAKDAYNASQVDRMANVITTIGQRELVLGRVRKGGTVFGRASTGTNHSKLFIAIALAAHEIDGIDAIYFNDKAVTLDGSGNVTSAPYAISKRTAKTLSFTGNTFTIPDATWDASSVNVTRNTGSGVDGSGSVTVPITGSTGATYTIGDSFGGDVTYQATSADAKAKVYMYFGGAGQAVSAPLNSQFGTDWPTTSTATGVAYLVVEFDYDDTAFPSGVPTVSAVVRGAKVYDPRTGLTAFSENPALLMRHVLTHPQFGKRTSMTADEDARIIAAANACDTSVTYTVGGTPVTRALFTAGTVLPFGNPAKSCLDDLAQAMAGMWAYAGGEFFVKAGVYTAPVMNLTDADLAVVVTDNGGSRKQQPITIGTHKPRANKVNVITPRIWDSGQDYKEVALTPLVASTLVTRDGAWLAQEVTMPAITYAPQALHVAGITIRDQRDPLTVTLPFKMTAYPLELFDSITLTIPRYGWSNKEFMVLGRQWTLDGLIQLTLKETASAIFQMDAAFSAQGYAVNTNLPTPWTINPPSNVVVASGPSNLQLNQDGTVTVRVKVSWDAITDSSILNGGTVEVQYRLASSSTWLSVSVPGTATYVYLYGANPGDVGFVQVRTKNLVAVSDFCTMISHTVTGKSAGPGTPTGFTATGFAQGIHLSCTPPTDVDLAYLELWRNTSNNLGTATKIAWGMQTSYNDAGLTASSTYYYWVRAVNTTGIAGSYAGPVSAVAGLTASPNPVTGLTATSIIGGIRLTCTLPSDADLAGIELWENTSNTLVGATLRASGLADHYDRLGLTPANGTYYFWVRTYNSSGTRGSSFVGPVSAVAGQAAAANIGSVSWSTVTGTGKPADNADVTTSILGASGTSIVMTNSNLFTSAAGTGARVYIGAGGIFGKDASNATTFSVDATTGAAYFKGTLDLNGTTGLTLTSGSSVGAIKLDSSGNLVFQGTAANKRIKLLAPNGGGISVDDFAVAGQTLIPLILPGGTQAGQWSSDGTRMYLQATGMDMQLNVGTVGGNTLTVNCGAFSFPGAAKLVTATSSLAAGNASGNVPVSNGTVNTNLNADMVDGHHASDFPLLTQVAKALIYQTTVTPSSTAIAGYIKVLSEDGTVGPVAIPFCNLP